LSPPANNPDWSSDTNESGDIRNVRARRTPNADAAETEQGAKMRAGRPRSDVIGTNDEHRALEQALHMQASLRSQ